MNTNRSYPPTPRPSSWSASPRPAPGAPHDDEARKELLATLAASRELGPEMDHTLTDRYLERLSERQARYAQYNPWQARSRRLTATNMRRFWPLAVMALAGLGALMLLGLMFALALHGGPPHDFGHGGASYNSYGDHSQGGASGQGAYGGDPDGGFFPLFGLFFWALPVLALIVFLRRRAAVRRMRYGRVGGVGPAAMGAARPYASQSAPIAQASDDPYAQDAPDERYAPYQPYQLFDYATTSAPRGAAPTFVPVSVPLTTPTRVFVEEVGQPTAPADATEDAATPAAVADGALAPGDVTSAPSAAGQAPTTAPRPSASPTGPLGNPAG